MMRYAAGALVIALAVAGPAWASTMTVTGSMGGRIYYDGQNVGTIPLRLTAVPAGKHVVRVVTGSGVQRTFDLEFPTGQKVDRVIDMDVELSRRVDPPIVPNPDAEDTARRYNQTREDVQTRYLRPGETYGPQTTRPYDASSYESTYPYASGSGVYAPSYASPYDAYGGYRGYDDSSNYRGYGGSGAFGGYGGYYGSYGGYSTSPGYYDTYSGLAPFLGSRGYGGGRYHDHGSNYGSSYGSNYGSNYGSRSSSSVSPFSPSAPAFSSAPFTSTPPPGIQGPVGTPTFRSPGSVVSGGTTPIRSSGQAGVIGGRRTDER